MDIWGMVRSRVITALGGSVAPVAAPTPKPAPVPVPRPPAPVPAAVAAVVPPSPTPAPAPANDVEAHFTDIGKFYDFLRGNNMLGPKISTSEYQGCQAILAACIRERYPVSYVAYALATAYLETNHTMQPIKEIGGTAYFTRMYDINGNRPKKARELGNLTPGDGARYPGRGYVQLTGKALYAKATAKLRAMGFDVDLVANPDLAMRPDLAGLIMAIGMIEGWFTTRKLPDDLPENGPAELRDFVLSRDIINGHDRENDVAAYAFQFQTGLIHAGYRQAA
jgi:putative chitinase